MDILFVHQNFPGQYKHLAPTLAAESGNRVIAVGEKQNILRRSQPNGVRVIAYPTPRGAGTHTHHYLRNTEAAVRRGQTVTRTVMNLQRNGFSPAIICAHPGWGETLFLKDVFPDAQLLTFCEFYYSAHGSDSNFDPEYPGKFDDTLRTRAKNSILLLSLEASDAGISPTQWQKRQHPDVFHERINVIHDGINTDTVHPDLTASLQLPDGMKLSTMDEVITYVARNLEPYRGFHIFMRALPDILRARPKAHVLIVGGDDVSYGHRPAGKRCYRELMLEELGEKLGRQRVHFMGRVPYPMFIKILQISSAHVYLTYPFVLSWSMLEAMAAGCVVIGSSTPPVAEVIHHGENGLLVDFFSVSELADTVITVLTHPERARELRENARKFIIENYDLTTRCLPAQLALIKNLTQT